MQCYESMMAIGLRCRLIARACGGAAVLDRWIEAKEAKKRGVKGGEGLSTYQGSAKQER